MSAAPSDTTAPAIITQPAAWNISCDQLALFQMAEITSNAAAITYAAIGMSVSGG